MSEAYVALGSNLGDRRRNLDEALARLRAAAFVRVVAVSDIRETEPVGGPPGQGPYLNAAVRIETSLGPRELLDLLRAIERALGRVRGGERNAARTIDLDLLVYGDRVIREPDLEVPHPRLFERPFVLEPLADLAPDLVPPLSPGGAPVRELLARLSRPSHEIREVESLASMRRLRRELRSEGRTVGFIPTMGALHEGHLSLVRCAKRECDVVVASIFVNPLQFGPGEDFERYPRDPAGDRDLLASAACDIVFHARREDMYPPGFATQVVQEALSAKLEGAIRPGHFRGVLTVVLKLFAIVEPDRSYFGQKDFQQTVAVRRMVADLNLPVDVVICPTVREPDGLAMSSRNRYLSAAERLEARALSAALRSALGGFREGVRSADGLRASMVDLLGRQAPSGRIDYAEVADAGTLDPIAAPRPVAAGDVALVAVRFGATRLIDNEVLG